MYSINLGFFGARNVMRGRERARELMFLLSVVILNYSPALM